MEQKLKDLKVTLDERLLKDINVSPDEKEKILHLVNNTPKRETYIKRNRLVYVFSILAASLLFLGLAYPLVYEEEKSSDKKVQENTKDQSPNLKESQDQAIEQFMNTINEEIINAFGLDLTDFTKIQDLEIPKNIPEKESLKDIYLQVLKEQQEGDVKPTLFVKNDNGYILEKKNNGVNKAHIIQLNQEGIWYVQKVLKKDGRNPDDIWISTLNAQK